MCDLLGIEIILVAVNLYHLQLDFRKLPLKFKWPASTNHYNIPMVIQGFVKPSQMV